MSLLIEDYALLGNTFTAALVGRDGSIDWLCLPRFDSGACFASLLGSPGNGRWLIAPKGECRATRRSYRDGTLILETEFETDEGVAVVTDFMPIVERHDEIDLVRIVSGKRGRVAMKMETIFRFDYGRTVPWMRRREHGYVATAGPNAIVLRADVPLRSEDFKTFADFTIDSGQQVSFAMTWFQSHQKEPVPVNPRRALSETEAFWSEWSGRCECEGRWGEPVLRSLITLKALTYQPTGGIVASPTTSLPEWIGGPRNWDYRFCWVRDATFTLYALMISGYITEAENWREWLLRAVAGRPQEMQIMYGLAGERLLPELEIGWLAGYQNSRPVRTGNAAHEQFQLDVYGEVMDTLNAAERYGLKQEPEAWNIRAALMDFLESGWRQPDEGIWEVRGGRQHFTHSKIMVWVAVDRAVKALKHHKKDGPIERWTALRDEIHRDVCAHGYDPERNAFVQYYGSKKLDASLLMTPLVGFLPITDPRIVGTVAAIQKELVVDGLVQRYSTDTGVDGLPPGEGAFLACSFWLADNLALMGRYQESRDLFERLLALRNDVGLLSEEYDPRAGRMLGNFPQAFSHVSLVNTAHNLTLAEGPAHRRAQT
jgi:GH15 family glucan-1,4-alpha-glucosidase